MEVPVAPGAGIVKEIKVAEGDSVSITVLYHDFEAEGAAEAAPAPAAEAAPVAAPAAAASAAELEEVHVPDIGGDGWEVTGNHVAIGDSVEEQSLLTVKGDKANGSSHHSAGTVKEIKIVWWLQCLLVL